MTHTIPGRGVPSDCVADRSHMPIAQVQQGGSVEYQGFVGLERWVRAMPRDEFVQQFRRLRPARRER